MARILAIIPALLISFQAAAYGEEIPVEEASMVYIIDHSCSMDSQYQTFTDENGNSVSGYRMIRAKGAVLDRIDDLGEDFRIDVVVHAVGQTAAYGELVHAHDQTADELAEWLDALPAEGESTPAEAVAWALQNPGYGEVMHFVVVTDGAANCDPGGEFCDDPMAYAELIDEVNQRGARIDVVLVGPGEDDDDPWVFGETVTGDSDGTLTIVD